jgi:ankyrin repeat protein
LETVKLLLELGANLQAQDEVGGTPLHTAVEGGQVETIKLLLESGANVHAHPKSGDTSLHMAVCVAGGQVETVKLLLEFGANMHAQNENGCTPLHHAASGGCVETVKLLLELGRANVHAKAKNGGTPLHAAAAGGHEETVKVLMEMGGSALARTTDGHTPQHCAESFGHEAVVIFLRKNAINKRRPKSTTAPIVDPAAQAAAEAAAAAMTALLIAEEEDQKQAPPSNKARKRRNRRKANPDELDTCSKGHDEVLSGSVASGSGRRDNTGEIDDMARDAAHHSKPDADFDVHVGEENAGIVFDNDSQNHNVPEGSIGRNIQRVEAYSVECEAGTLRSGVEQPTSTPTERRQQKERERKGKQRQQKRATTSAILEEALARVDTAGASLDSLNALDAAMISAKRILQHSDASSSTDAPVMSSSASSDLPELLRQAEEKSLNLRSKMHAMANKAAAYDQLEEGLVRSAVAESSAQI